MWHRKYLKYVVGQKIIFFHYNQNFIWNNTKDFWNNRKVTGEYNINDNI